MGEDRGDDQRVLRVEAADERLPERRDFLGQLALREFGEHLRIGGAGDERVEHRPPGGAEDVGREGARLPPRGARASTLERP